MDGVPSRAGTHPTWVEAAGCSTRNREPQSGSRLWAEAYDRAVECPPWTRLTTAARVLSTPNRREAPSVDPSWARLPGGVHLLRATAYIDRPLDEVFPFFAAAENLERITPPSLRFRVTTPTPIEMRVGTLIDYRLRLNGVPFGWRTEISEWDPPRAFTDRQLEGPYHTWVHRHTFEPEGRGTFMVDEVRYRLPLWPLGDVALPIVRRQLAGIFRYRAQSLAEHFAGRCRLGGEVDAPRPNGKCAVRYFTK